MTRPFSFQGLCVPQGRLSSETAAGIVVARRFVSVLHLGHYQYVNVANHDTLFSEILIWEIRTEFLIQLTFFKKSEHELSLERIWAKNEINIPVLHWT